MSNLSISIARQFLCGQYAISCNINIIYCNLIIKHYQYLNIAYSIFKIFHKLILKFNIESSVAIKIATKLKTLIMLSGCNFLWHITIYTFFRNLYYTFLANCTCKHQTIWMLSILHIDNIDNIKYIENENTQVIFSCNMHFLGCINISLKPFLMTEVFQYPISYCYLAFRATSKYIILYCIQIPIWRRLLIPIHCTGNIEHRVLNTHQY